MNSFYKLQEIETVSNRRRHRSNHTQKIIPSVVAGHQLFIIIIIITLRVRSWRARTAMR